MGAVGKAGEVRYNFRRYYVRRYFKIHLPRADGDLHAGPLGKEELRSYRGVAVHVVFKIVLALMRVLFVPDRDVRVFDIAYKPKAVKIRISIGKREIFTEGLSVCRVCNFDLRGMGVVNKGILPVVGLAVSCYRTC